MKPPIHLSTSFGPPPSPSLFDWRHGRSFGPSPSLFLACSTLVLFVAACGPFRAPVAEDTMMNREQVTFLGFKNAATTSAVRAKADRLETGQLRVRVQFIKQSFGSAFVEVKTYFLDADGFELEATNWEPVHLHEDVHTQHETVSLSSDAVDFRIVVRRPPG